MGYIRLEKDANGIVELIQMCACPNARHMPKGGDKRNMSRTGQRDTIKFHWDPDNLNRWKVSVAIQTDPILTNRILLSAVPEYQQQ